MRTEEKNAFKIVGMKVVTDMENVSKDCGKLWEGFMGRMDDIKNKADPKVCYGLSVMKSEKEMDCYACYEVENFDDIPEGMESLDVPTNKYAIVEHKGPAKTVGQTWEKVMTNVPAAGHKMKMDSPCFERYDERFKNDEESISEIWMPIE